MPRLADAARALLDAATEIARARRHGVIDELHVFAVVASNDGNAARFDERCVDLVALRALVDDALAAKEDRGMYRDGALPVPSEKLRRLLFADRAERHGLFASLRDVSAEEIVGVLLEEPAIVALMLAAGRPIGSVRDGVVLARAAAVARGHGTVTLLHFARVLADDAAVVASCANASASAIDALAQLRARLEERMATDCGPARDGAFAPLEATTTLRRFLFDEAPPSRRTRLYARPLLAATLGSDEISTLFEGDPSIVATIVKALRSEVKRESRVARAAEETARDEAELLGLPADATLDVVFHDDDGTSLDLLVAILRDCFHLPTQEALRLMVGVHMRGHAVIGSFPAHEAKLLAAAARARAREARAPLHVSLERTPELP